MCREKEAKKSKKKDEAAQNGSLSPNGDDNDDVSTNFCSAKIMASLAYSYWVALELQMSVQIWDHLRWWCAQI